MRVGFVALTDVAPLVVAHHMGMYRQRGLPVTLVRQASWPALRDALLTGGVDAAHCLFSLPLSVALGITGRPDQTLVITMVMNTNGQAITLGTALAEGASPDPAQGMRAILEHSRRRRLTLAMTYPGGTHDVWLRYWLAAAGVGRDAVDIIPIPPAQMVANLRGATMDGFSAGEPWNAVAVARGIGFTAVGSHDVFPGHPEKALVVAAPVLRDRPGEVRALMAGTLAACRWLDHDGNRALAAGLLAAPQVIDAPARVIRGRLRGSYRLGAHLGRLVLPTDRTVRFHDGGAVNAPSRAHALWFIAQFRRLGLLRGGEAGDTALVRRLVARELYEEVAQAEGIPVPRPDMLPFTVALDGAGFDPRDPGAEAARRPRALRAV